MDDGYAVGPADIVFDAVDRFAEAVATAGLELRVGKCCCFSYGADLMRCAHRPSNMPIGTLTDANGRAGNGIAVGGVPIGDGVFTELFLKAKVTRATSKIDKLFPSSASRTCSLCGHACITLCNRSFSTGCNTAIPRTAGNTQ
eukprot:3733222-Karenia_brevis.AAC.1